MSNAAVVYQTSVKESKYVPIVKIQLSYFANHKYNIVLT